MVRRALLAAILGAWALAPATTQAGSLKVVRQAGLPFQTGASPVVSVSVRP